MDDAKNFRFDLNTVRLCFHIRLDSERRWLEPCISEPIENQSTVNDLRVMEVAPTTVRAQGGDRCLLFCEKINPKDISIRLYQLHSDADAAGHGRYSWRSEIDHRNYVAHHKFGIAFTVPPYKDVHIVEPVTVLFELFSSRKPEVASEAIEFEYIPDPSRKLKCVRFSWSLIF